MNEFLDKTILIAEDDPTILSSYKNAFKKIFGEVITASCGNDAIEIIKTEDIDVLLTDVNMHNGTGIDIIEYITLNNLKVPIVVVTAHNELTGICRENVECIICHTKPANILKIIEDIKTLMDRSCHDDIYIKIDDHIAQARAFLETL